MERRPITVTEDEQLALRRLKAVMEEALKRGDALHFRLATIDGEDVELPKTVLHILQQAIRYLAQDKAVMVVAVNKELTSQEAADVLNVSRPYLVKLLEQGEIPFTKTGTHRRIQLADLLEYKMRRDAERDQALTELTQLSQEMGLYNE